MTFLFIETRQTSRLSFLLFMYFFYPSRYWIDVIWYFGFTSCEESWQCYIINSFCSHLYYSIWKASSWFLPARNLTLYFLMVVGLSCATNIIARSNCCWYGTCTRDSQLSTNRFEQRYSFMLKNWFTEKNLSYLKVLLLWIWSLKLIYLNSPQFFFL